MPEWFSVLDEVALFWMSSWLFVCWTIGSRTILPRSVSDILYFLIAPLVALSIPVISGYARLRFWLLCLRYRPPARGTLLEYEGEVFMTLWPDTEWWGVWQGEAERLDYDDLADQYVKFGPAFVRDAKPYTPPELAPLKHVRG